MHTIAVIINAEVTKQTLIKIRNIIYIYMHKIEIILNINKDYINFKFHFSIKICNSYL